MKPRRLKISTYLWCMLPILLISFTGCDRLGLQPSMHTSLVPQINVTQNAENVPKPATADDAVASCEIASADSKPTDVHSQRIVREGIAVEFTVEQSDARPKDGEQQFTEGDAVTVRFKITDTTTGTPLTTLEPAGWLHAAQDSESADAKVKSFLTGSLSSRADVDLNVFYALAMNENATISVVDPLFGYGGSKLLAMIQLTSPGQDWVLNDDQSRLYVTMPDANQVAVIDTSTWKVTKNVDTGNQPMRIGFQPDGKYLWVACDSETGVGSVTAIDGETHEVVKQLQVGSGHHEFAFTDDSQYLFVTNQTSDALSRIDTRKLEVIDEIPTGHGTTWVAYDEPGQVVYAVNAVKGTIAVIDIHRAEIVRTIQAERGIRSVHFAPNTQLAFALNPLESLVHVIDTSAHRIVQSGEVGKTPDQVVFTENLAYIRSLDTEHVFMIPLDQVGVEEAKIPVIDFAGGHQPVGTMANLGLAAGIMPAPGGVAVLVANAPDKTIYYYREGMAAPMGEFQNYGRNPRAVLVVDNSLREAESGVYETDVRLDVSGKVDCCFFLDSPRIVHCFQFDVEPSAAKLAEAHDAPLAIRSLAEAFTFVAGEPAKLRFQVTDPKTQKPQIELLDFGVLVNTPGNWQNRQWARHSGEGIYEIEFTPPKDGTYYVSFQCPSLGVRFNDIPPMIFTGIVEN